MSTGLLQDIGEGVICPAGAASKILSSGPAENISLHGLVETALCPSSITRGVSRSSRTWSGMRWTRRRFARDGIAGRVVFRWTCGGYSCATLPMQRLRVQRAPAFPTPSVGRKLNARLGRIAPRDLYACLEIVIASEAKQSILSLRGELDCFAPLAMTAQHLNRRGCLKSEPRHCEERSDEAIHSFFAR